MPLTPRTTRFLAICAAISLLTACGRGSSAEDFLTRGSQHFDAGNYSAASIELSNALQQNPDLREARWLLARTALELGEADRAERDLRRAIELGIPRAEAQPLLVRALMMQGALERVLTETALPIPDAPAASRATLLGYRAQALLLGGDLAEGEAAAKSALEIAPDAAQAMIAMALLEAGRGDREAAANWLEQVTSGPQPAPEAWSLAGDLALEDGRLADAEAAFGQAIAARAFNTLDHAKRAIARLHQGKLDEAEADVRHLRQAGLARHPFVHYVDGLVHFARGRTLDAANAFEASFAANPAFLPNRLYLAIARLQLGETEQAMRHAQFVLSQVPESATLQQLMGEIHMNRADFAAARAALEKAQHANPDDPTLLNMLAASALLGGDAAAGVTYASRLVTALPDSPQARHTLMLARLMANEAMDDSVATDADYQQQFLLGLAAFRDNRFGEALDIARALQASHPELIDPINLAAAVHLATGDWPQARSEFERVLAVQPDDAPTRLNLARIEAAAGNQEAVRTLVRPVVVATPDNESALLMLAEAEARLGNTPEALRLLDQGLSLVPNSLQIRAALGGMHLALGDPARVLDLLRGLTAAQFDGLPRLLELRGRAELATGNLSSARSSFEQWVRRAPDSPAAHFHLAEAQAMAGEPALARASLEQAIALAPGYVDARLGLVRLLTRMTELQAANEQVTRLLAEHGQRRDVLATAGWFQVLTGQFAEGEKQLSRAIEIAEDSELSILLVRALWGQQRHDEALARLADWLQRHPTDVAARLHEAGAFLSLGREADAVASYRKVLEVAPEHVPSLNNVAWLTRKTDPDAALKLIQRAHELAPEDPHVLDTMGMLMLERGDASRARFFVAQAVEHAPADAQIRLHLADILVRLQRWDEARVAADTVLTLSADATIHDEARALLARIDARR